MPIASKGELTAERILDAAFKSIAAKGCAGVTLRGIADEAGVALGQLNYYFENKDGLFSAVLGRMKQDYAIGLTHWLKDSNTLRERITALVDYHEFLLQENTNIYRNFLEFFNVALGSDKFRAEVATLLSDTTSMIEDQVIRHKDRHELPDFTSSAVITRFILSASFGISMQHLLNPEDTDIQAGFQIIKTSTAALFPEKSVSHDE